MKKIIIIIGLLSFTISMISQSINYRFQISSGFGFQQYRGDLGEGFYRFNSTEYGVSSLAVDYYISPSIDIKFLGTIGDLGYCQPDDKKIITTHVHDDSHVHGENPESENLNSRMGSGIIAIQYKLANGHILPQESSLSPFFYAGAGINRLTDRMKMECVVPGTYYTLNMGTGFKYKLSPSFFLGYTLSFGWFTSDNLDFIDKGGNDMYMQNSAIVGYSF